MSRAFRVGSWTIEPERNRVSGAGGEVRLEPKVMEVLLCLARQPGEVVSKEQLLAAVWAETFVTDDVLTRAISELRRAFGEDAQHPHVIETIPKRGYRLVAAVERVENGGTLAPRRRKVTAALAAGGLLLAVVVAWALLRPSESRVTSIAVRPLVNLSHDPEQEYIADGITDALIHQLGQIRSLTVISRTSVMSYKNSGKSLPEIARELRVDAVVEGSVQRSGGRIAIVARLKEAATERQLWSDEFEHDFSDVLLLRSELARAIARGVNATVTPQEGLRLASVRTVHAEAYEHYLKGRQHWNHLNQPGMVKAKEHFEKAIDLDAEFAEAWAGLADTYSWSLWGTRLFAAQQDLVVGARQAATRALELDDSLAEAHAALGWIREVVDWDWKRAEWHYRRAVELNPSYPTAQLYMAFWMSFVHRHEEALVHVRRAQQLDPLSPALRTQVGWVQFWAQDFDAAIAQWRRTLELDPDFAVAHYNLGLGYTEKAMYSEAIAAFHKSLALDPSTQTVPLVRAYAKAGRADDALKLLAELKRHGKADLTLQATVYVALNNSERALELLQEAYGEHNFKLPHVLRREPFILNGLQSNPEFQELVRRMNFPD
jgi:pentatricopeptide repeat protein